MGENESMMTPLGPMMKKCVLYFITGSKLTVKKLFNCEKTICLGFDFG